MFRSEGVAVADVNKDGKMDILNGEAWYEAPDWKMHPIRKLGDYSNGDGPYSHSFACWAEDFNGDGYPDLIVVDFPGAPCYWFENPKGDGRRCGSKHDHLAQRLQRDAAVRRPVRQRQARAGHGLPAEGPGSGGNEGQMAWFAPGKDPTQPVGDAPDQRAERARQGDPRHASSSRTASASATSTATAAPT